LGPIRTRRQTGFGTLVGDRVHEHVGDMFGACDATHAQHALADVTLLCPCTPTKVIALWNNFPRARRQARLADPEEPLYLLKAPNSWSAHGAPIAKPRRDAKVAFEGELGIVIGRTCAGVSEADALSHVFGYTCGTT
jgi:2-keto-4-pentenoate hydratase/2-oxohepta-3-ene-1,7-dioic acid hydratase in catechol pathway